MILPSHLARLAWLTQIITKIFDDFRFCVDRGQSHDILFETAGNIKEQKLKRRDVGIEMRRIETIPRIEPEFLVVRQIARSPRRGIAHFHTHRPMARSIGTRQKDILALLMKFREAREMKLIWILAGLEHRDAFVADQQPNSVREIITNFFEFNANVCRWAARF